MNLIALSIWMRNSKISLSVNLHFCLMSSPKSWPFQLDDTVCIFHYQTQLIFPGKTAVEPNNVRMDKLFHDSNFVLNRIRIFIRVHHLHHKLVIICVFHQIHFSIRSPSQQLFFLKREIAWLIYFVVIRGLVHSIEFN